MNAIPFISFQSFLAFLARKRFALALKRHETYRVWSLFETGVDNDPIKKYPNNYCLGVADFLPPRRQWKRVGLAARKGMSQQMVTVRSIIRFVMAIYSKTPDGGTALCIYPWGTKLWNLYCTILQRVMKDHFQFSPPEIHCIPKNDKEDRCVTVFNNLEDGVILSCLTRYLTDLFDPLFLDCSYAFRSKGKGGFNGAVDALRNFRLSHSGPLYVAECDIRKFYDTINHNVVLCAIAQLKVRLGRCGKHLDPCAERILRAYFTCYSFNRNVNGSDNERIRDALKRGRIPWIESSALNAVYGGVVPIDEIGIPQGGALSPLLANCVLDEVDRVVRVDDEHHDPASPDPDVFYARFCDDMIIVSPNRGKCEAAFSRYCITMKRLHLPIHKVTSDTISPHAQYSREWWDGKSRGPYLWAKNAIPWVGFVGYQIRYDGGVRVRQRNVDEVERKIRKEVTTWCRLWCDYKQSHQVPTIVEQVRMSEGSHLNGRLAGRAAYRFGKANERVSETCWIDAFKLLRTYLGRSAIRQLKYLDWYRSKMLWTFEHLLGVAGQSIPNRIVKFWGRPFSIYGAVTTKRNYVFRRYHDDGSGTRSSPY